MHYISSSAFNVQGNCNCNNGLHNFIRNACANNYELDDLLVVKVYKQDMASTNVVVGDTVIATMVVTPLDALSLPLNP